MLHRVLRMLDSDRVLHITVMESDPAGAPTRVRFQFASALEAPERAWCTRQGTGLVPCQPPALGQRVPCRASG